MNRQNLPTTIWSSLPNSLFGLKTSFSEDGVFIQNVTKNIHIIKGAFK
jgi:hypothetical protein